MLGETRRRHRVATTPLLLLNIALVGERLRRVHATDGHAVVGGHVRVMGHALALGRELLLRRLFGRVDLVRVVDAVLTTLRGFGSVQACLYRELALKIHTPNGKRGEAIPGSSSCPQPW